jgi:hypothetical protein
MKIRIKGNSVRYRLTRSEVTRLWEKGFIEDQTTFFTKTLRYYIEVTASDELKADFTLDDSIILYLPQKMIDAMQHTEIVGFDNQHGPVSLLIEKDFVCIDNTTEDQSDNYPNPSLNC